jgi:hypothetical protein
MSRSVSINHLGAEMKNPPVMRGGPFFYEGAKFRSNAVLGLVPLEYGSGVPLPGQVRTWDLSLRAISTSARSRIRTSRNFQISRPEAAWS